VTESILVEKSIYEVLILILMLLFIVSQVIKWIRRFMLWFLNI